MSDLGSVIRDIRPCESCEPYIFISYSSADRELVWRDVLEFQRRGYNVWLDEKNLDKTKDSWKEDALAAIEDMDCELLVFYVSASSLSSDACYQELSKTTADSTKALHFGPVKFIAIDAEEVGNITQFHQQVFEKIRNSELDKGERRKQALALNGFMKNFFNSNNEKVRIHPKNEVNRKMDYYEEILAAFPDTTRIYPVMLNEEGDMSGEDKGKEIKRSEAVEISEAPKAVEISEAPKETGDPGAMEETKMIGEPKAAETEEKAKAAETAESVETLQKSEAAEAPEKTDTAEESTAQETPEEAKNPEQSGEENIHTVSAQEYFTCYEEPPKGWAEGRRIFTKKHIKEAQQGSGIYRVVPGYTGIDIQLFGSVLGGREDMVRLTLPDTIREFNSGEFKNCVNLREVRIPKYLTEIRNEAFKGCSSLKYVEIPGNVQSIGPWAFQGCSSLEKLKLPMGLKKIEMGAFDKCYSLKELHLPDTLTELSMQCFRGCSSLSEVVIPKGLRELPSDAFSECASLKKVVLLEGVEEIGAAFQKCGSELELWIPDSVKRISGIAFLKTAPVIHCRKNSYAHSFAQKERISYVLCDENG